MSDTVLITGANRGIGFALTRVFLSKGYVVLAGVRNPGSAKALSGLQTANPKSLHLLPLEVTSEASVKAAAEVAARIVDHLDILANNAGVSPPPHDAKLENLDLTTCEEAFRVNCMGPLRVSRAFLPLLRKSRNPRVSNTSSGAGSISGKDNGLFYAYGPSKAALNMISRTMAFEFKGEGITVVALDPGWVRTDLGGPNAWLAPEESAEAIAGTLESLTLERTGKFLYNDGKELNW